MNQQIRSQVLCFQHHHKNIYGEIFFPAEVKKEYPAIIICHGFSVNADAMREDAVLFAKAGFAAYIFDFCGGGQECRSSGTMMDMSVLTEKEDLLCVIDHLYLETFVDRRYLFLMGESQGGLVCELCAAERKNIIKAMVLFYPANTIPDQMRQMFPHEDRIPAFFEQFGFRVSRKYAQDVYRLNMRTVYEGYDKDVLILHGDQDTIIPLSSSYDTGAAYCSAQLIVIPDGTHGFYGSAAYHANLLVQDFLKKRYLPEKSGS